MNRAIPLLFLAALAAEIASIIWIGGLLGTVPTLCLIIFDFILGVRLIKAAGMSMAQALRAPVQPAAPLRNLGEKAAARAMSGLLFMLPGFFSDLLGVALFLPQVRQWIGSKFRIATFQAESPRGKHRFEQVIDAEAVEITGEINPPQRLPD